VCERVCVCICAYSLIYHIAVFFVTPSYEEEQMCVLCVVCVIYVLQTRAKWEMIVSFGVCACVCAGVTIWLFAFCL
jgi:hypothetical protein